LTRKTYRVTKLRLACAYLRLEGTMKQNNSSATKVATQALSSSAEDEKAMLMPLEVIRIENVISKFPVHNLAKTGRVNIRVNRKRADGEVEFRWEVSYNERYGEAKQLAYQIDTLIIAKRLHDYFEANKPTPEVIPIGSLYQICQELGMNPQSGKNKNNIKRALAQNAGAFIDAHISFKDRNGEERRLSAQFTRYAVVHRDQKLPDGRKADQVYIVLQPVYLEVLNSARWRPLDFTYLKELPPASQRCYEIISTRIFAALKYGHPRAELTYSDYCLFSAQMRHAKYKSFRAQMDHVHKPHLSSGYLTKVEYKETLDEEGKPDWVIAYYPGPKARAEFSHFNPRLNDAALPKSTVTDGVGKSNESRDLVAYFHRLVHKADHEHEPMKRELEQAARLIELCGADVARYIVEFAHKEAPKTKFEMQVFGAVLVYEKRALASYERRKKSRAGSKPTTTQWENETDAQSLSEAERIASLITEAIERLRQAAANISASGMPVLLDACIAAEWDLGDLRDRIATVDKDLPVDLAAVEGRLVAAEDRITEALWQSTSSDELEKMSKASGAELQRYKASMEPEAYKDILRRHVTTRLREQYAMPRLSLFYLW
jgi:hypothetical protein